MLKISVEGFSYPTVTQNVNIVVASRYPDVKLKVVIKRYINFEIETCLEALNTHWCIEQTLLILKAVNLIL